MNRRDFLWSAAAVAMLGPAVARRDITAPEVIIRNNEPFRFFAFDIGSAEKSVLSILEHLDSEIVGSFHLDLSAMGRGASNQKECEK